MSKLYFFTLSMILEVGCIFDEGASGSSALPDRTLPLTSNPFQVLAEETDGSSLPLPAEILDFVLTTSSMLGLDSVIQSLSRDCAKLVPLVGTEETQVWF